MFRPGSAAPMVAAILVPCAVLLLCGCPGTGNDCERTCPGCCRAGKCEPGITPDACGLGGGECGQCGPGVACLNGECKVAGGTCGCPTGCCDTSNTCQSGSSNLNCGSGGEKCKQCPAGTACAGGQCVPPTCQCPDGCCNLTQCEPGDSDTACGAGAQPCINCSVLGQICNKGTRECTTTAGCGNCPASMCCDGTLCERGDTDLACGTGGAMCTNCLGLGQKCDPVNRVCAGCANCDLGCCIGTACEPGDTDLVCGSGGDNCVNCTVLGKKCRVKDGKRECLPWCDDCDMGCCFGPSCVAGTGDSACGIAGEKCEDCASLGQTCLAGSRVCSGAGCPNCHTGCCQGDVCKPGNEQDACGKDGRPCINCGLASSGFQCNPPDNLCGPPPNP